MELKYTPYKIFHFPEVIDSFKSKPESISPPIHVRIKPINLCNHHCWFCSYKADGVELGETMRTQDQIPEEKMLEIADDLVDMGVKAVTFSGGGEPFLYKPLLRTAQRLVEGGIKIASLTNGSRLTGEPAEFFAQYATWLRISLDAWDDKSYTASRKVRDGEFSRLMRRIRDFIRLNGVCALGVNLIVDHKNARHVYDTVCLLRGIGVNNVKVSPCIISNDAQKNLAYHQSIFSLVRKQVEQLISKSPSDSFELFDAYHEFDTKFDKDYEWCPYLQLLCVIGADLNVYSCQDKAYTDSGLLGTIQHQRFAEFWISGREKFFRINPSHGCRHHCTANRKNLMLHEYLQTHPDHQAFI